MLFESNADLLAGLSVLSIVGAVKLTPRFAFGGRGRALGLLELASPSNEAGSDHLVRVHRQGAVGSAARAGSHLWQCEPNAGVAVSVTTLPRA